MSVSYGGIGESVVTMKAASGLVAGVLAKMSASDTVSAAGDGEIFCGKVLSVRGGYAAVQVGGFISAAYTGTAPAVGFTKLESDAAGASVHADAANGREVLVVSVDSTGETVTFRL